MKRIKRLCIPVLLGMVLIVAVVGVASARPNARPLEQAWRVLTVGTSACVPCTDDEDYDRAEGDPLHCLATGNCCFICPVYFPAAGEQAVGAVNVKRVTMYAYDNTATKAVDFLVVKAYPPAKAGTVYMATGGTTDSSSDPQVVMDTSIEGNPIYRVQEPAIVLTMGSSVRIYGLFIHYTW